MVVLSCLIMLRCCLMIMSDVSLCYVGLDRVMMYIFRPVGGSTLSFKIAFKPPITAGSCFVAHCTPIASVKTLLPASSVSHIRFNCRSRCTSASISSWIPFSSAILNLSLFTTLLLPSR